MYQEQLQQIIDQQTANVRELVAKADAEIHRLAQRIGQLDAELKAIREARCPDCNSPLPADRVCRVCMAKKTLVTGDGLQAYRRGAEDLALCIAAVRKLGLHAGKYYVLIALIDSLVEQIADPDRIGVAERAAAALRASQVYADADDGEDGLSFQKLREAFGL